MRFTLNEDSKARAIGMFYVAYAIRNTIEKTLIHAQPICDRFQLSDCPSGTSQIQRKASLWLRSPLIITSSIIVSISIVHRFYFCLLLDGSSLLFVEHYITPVYTVRLHIAAAAAGYLFVRSVGRSFAAWPLSTVVHSENLFLHQIVMMCTTAFLSKQNHLLPFVSDLFSNFLVAFSGGQFAM